VLIEIPEQRTSSHTNEMVRYASLGSGSLRSVERACGHVTCFFYALENDANGLRAGARIPNSAHSQ
jgi:hypothetical protein